MTVKELIEELKKFPEDREVVMFDGPAGTPRARSMWPTGEERG